MKRLTTGFTLAVLGSALWAVSASAWRAQAQQLPHAFISVLDSNDTPVSDLKPSQVSMVLDGTECMPLKLEPIDWPVKLTVLVDNGDVSTNTLPVIREGLHRFLAELPDVEISLLTLAPQPRWVVQPTVQRQDFFKGVDRLSHSGAAKLVEGLAEAADRIDKAKGDFFYTIVVITTNGPESSGGDVQQTFNRLRGQILKRPVTVHALMLSVSQLKTTQTASGSPVPGSVGSPTGRVSNGGSVVSREGLPLKNMGALQTQVNAALTKDTGGRFENISAESNLLVVLPEYGRQIARSAVLQSHQYRVSCDRPVSATSQMSVFTSYSGAHGVVVTRDGRIP